MPRARAKTHKVSEKDIQNQMKQWLILKGCVCLRRNVAGARKMPDGSYLKLGSVGQSDLWGKLPDGRHFELEVKKPGKRPTPKQVDWLIAMNGSGRDRSVAFWASSLDDVRQVFERVMSGWRVVYDNKPKPGDFCLTPEVVPAGHEGE